MKKAAKSWGLRKNNLEDLTALYSDALTDFKKNRLSEAEGKLRKVISRTPSFQDAYEALSVILYNQKKYDDAIAIIQRWINVNPAAIMAHTNLSRCYVEKGMIEEAEKAQAESRRLSWKAELRQESKPTDAQFEEQIIRFKKVIEFDPNDVLGYFSLGSVYLQAGRYRDAADTFDKAVSIDPSHSSSYLGLGKALEALGDKNKAKFIYAKGVEAADAKGDMVPLKKMEARLKALS